MKIKMTKQETPREMGLYVIRRDPTAPLVFVEVTGSGACYAHGAGNIVVLPGSLWSEKIEIEGYTVH
jgi:hypothetical protein